ncbi:hypothetical protein ACOME3_004062 [Neoechinorhynchus agilis]
MESKVQSHSDQLPNDTTIPMVSGEMDGPPLNASRWSLNSLRRMNPSEWYQSQKNSVRPWLEFLNTSRISLPKTPRRAIRRVLSNVEYFQSNYFIIFVVLGIYSIVTSPLILLVVIIMLLGFYMVNTKSSSQSPLTLFGRQVPVFYQYVAVVAFSLPLFFLAKATSVIFWILGASIGIVLVHSALYTPSQQEDSFVQAEV